MAAATVFLALLAVSGAAADSDFEAVWGVGRSINDAHTTRGYGGRRLFQGELNPYAYSPSPSPSPSPEGGDESPSPSPLPSPEASPSPSPLPSPSPEGGNESPPPAEQTCAGVAYDGYLSNCKLDFYARDADITPATQVYKTVNVIDGDFETGTPRNLLGAGFLQPAPANTPRVAVPLGQTPGFCYDTITRLPEMLPLSTIQPKDCALPVVVDISSTLLQYGLQYGVKSEDVAAQPFTAEALKKAFGFSDSMNLGHFDAIEALTSTDAGVQADGLAALKSQSLVRNWITIIAQAKTKEAANMQSIARQMFVALAQHVMNTRQSRINDESNLPATRRRLNQQTERILDLTQESELSQLYITAEAQIQVATAAGQLDSSWVAAVDPSVQQAITKAIATVNAITQRSTSFTEVQKATQVVLTTLSVTVEKLVRQEIDVAAFTAQTSEQALQEAVQQATLAGEQAPVQAEESNSNKGALIGGLVGGLGGGLLLITAVAGYIIYRKRHGAGASPAQ